MVSSSLSSCRNLGLVLRFLSRCCVGVGVGVAKRVKEEKSRSQQRHSTCSTVFGVVVVALVLAAVVAAARLVVSYEAILSARPSSDLHR